MTESTGTDPALAALVRIDELERTRATLRPAHAQYAAARREFGRRRVSALAQAHGLAPRTRRRALRFGAVGLGGVAIYLLIVPWLTTQSLPVQWAGIGLPGVGLVAAVTEFVRTIRAR